MISLSSLRRIGVSAALSLGAMAAMSFAPREARASGWTCQSIDGPNSTWFSGHTSSPMYLVGQSVLFDSHVWLFYEYTASGVQSYNKMGVRDFLGATWTFDGLDGPGVGVPAATVYNNEVWTAYADQYQALKVAHGTYTGFTHDDPSAALLGKPAMAVLGTKLYVAFDVWEWSADHSHAHNAVEAVVFDGTSWGAVQAVDGDVGTPDSDQDESFQTAITYNGAVHILFYDPGSGELKQRTTTNGTTWSSVQVIDGSGTGGQTSHDVGNNATAMVDASGTLRVFYWDATSSVIRVASSTNGTTWSFQTAASNANPGSWAPVPHSVPQIYYTDTSGAMRGASLVNGSWSNGIVDGPGSSSATCSGHTTSALYANIVGVEQNGGPHLYYIDQTNHALREAFFTP